MSNKVCPRNCAANCSECELEEKKLKALDFLKEHLTLITIKSGKQLLDINYWDDEEGFDLVKEILL